MIRELHIRFLQYRIAAIDAYWNASNVYSSYWRMYINNCNGPELILPTCRYTLLKNRIYFIPSWVRFTCYNDRPVKNFYVHFDIVGLSDIVVRHIFNRPFCLSHEVNFDAIVSKLKPVPHDHPQDLHFQCRAKSLVYDNLATLLDELPMEQSQEIYRFLSSRNIFAPTLEYIETHLGDNLTNDQLANIAHMSESHFAHRFKDLLGQTPARYVLDRRIASAAQKLIFTDASIDQIAWNTGFANRFHFSRNFKNIMGITPAVYRKTTRV